MNKRLRGVIRSFPVRDGRERDFTFIEVSKDEKYFLHITGFKGSWKKLVTLKRPIQIEFEATEVPSKGIRAINAQVVSDE